VVNIQIGFVALDIFLINSMLSYSPGWSDCNGVNFTCKFEGLDEIGAGGVSGLVVGC
jgi:hypothetical protein